MVILVLAALCGVTASAQPGDEQLCADQNGDGIVSPSDFTIWVQNFNAGSILADVNGDGSVTPADFTSWVLAFNQGESGPVCSPVVAGGERFVGAIDFEGDVDTYRIQALAGDSLLIVADELVDGSPLGVRVEVAAPDGGVIASDVSGLGVRVDEFDLPASGTYRIVVSDNNDLRTGGYALSIVRISPDTINIGSVTLPNGVTVDGEFVTGDIDVYTVDVGLGGTLLVAIDETVDVPLELAVDVFGPDGSREGNSVVRFGTAFKFLEVDAPGRYTIVVRDDNGSRNGAYRLTAAVLDGAAGGAFDNLESGETVSDQIDTGDIDVYEIEVAHGGALLVTAGETEEAPLQLRLSIYNAAGERLRTSLSGAGTQANVIPVPGPGVYRVVVRDGNGFREGPYALTAVAVDSVPDSFDALPLAAGVAAAGRIDAGDIDTFTFTAAAGDPISVTASEIGDEPLLIRLLLFAPDGGLLVSRVIGSTVSISVPSAPQAGQYTAVVRDDAGSAEGDYEIVLAP